MSGSGQKEGAINYKMTRRDNSYKNTRHGQNIQIPVYSVEPSVAHGGQFYWNTEDKCMYYSVGVDQWVCVDANISLNSGDCIDGNSLVINTTSPNLLIRQLKAGANVTIDDTDANCLVIDTISSSSPSSSQKLYVSHSYSGLKIDANVLTSETGAFIRFNSGSALSSSVFYMTVPQSEPGLTLDSIQVIGEAGSSSTSGNLFCSFTLIEDITSDSLAPVTTYGKLTVTDFDIPIIGSDTNPDLNGRYSIRKTDIQNWPVVAPTNPAAFQVCMKLWRSGLSYISGNNGWLDSVIFEFTRT